jgi:Glucodextranase, domain B
MTDKARKARSRRTGVIACAATLLALVVAGCGGGAQSPPAVQLALTAPTEDAEVTAADIKVFGTVDPANATVLVAGKHVRVEHGAFARWMALHKGLSHIKIVATAAGYVPDRMDIAVTSSPSAPSTHISTSAAPTASETTPSPAPAAPAASHYQPTLRANFLRTCKAAAGDVAAADAKCDCALAYVEARVPEATLAADERALLEGRATLPSWDREAGLACSAA